jgi:hypothetical protein
LFGLRGALIHATCAYILVIAAQRHVPAADTVLLWKIVSMQCSPAQQLRIICSATATLQTHPLAADTPPPFELKLKARKAASHDERHHDCDVVRLASTRPKQARHQPLSLHAAAGAAAAAALKRQASGYIPTAGQSRPHQPDAVT